LTGGCAAVLALSVVSTPAARAQNGPAPSFWFAGTRLIFDSPVALDGDVAVSVRDSGLQRLLARVGASISYAPQQRYIVITSADRRLITLTVGDVRYSVAGVVSTATFAPFFDNNDVIVPLYAIARALYLAPVAAGGETVFEPQIGTLDVRPDGRRTIVTLHGATALKYVKLGETPERLALTFNGIGSALGESRRIGGGVDEVDVAESGSVKNPASTVTIVAPKGTQHQIVATSSPYDFVVVFGPPGVALDLSAPAPAAAAQRIALPAPAPVQRAAGPVPAPAPQRPAAPQPTAAPPQDGESGVPELSNAPGAGPGAAPPQGVPQTGAATVTDVAVEAQAQGGVNVALSIQGTPTYEWHRLRDNRWYLDIDDAILGAGAREERPPSTAVESVRVRQIGTADAPIVRVAFTMRGDLHVDVIPAEGRLTIAVANVEDADVARSGTGQVGAPAVAQNGAQPPAAAAAAQPAPVAAQPGLVAPQPAKPWRFGPSGAANNVIVIDPGHGGEDAGTAHNGLVEKRITLDISLRLRALLTQAGWSVRMTRDTDIDPVSPDLMAAFSGDGRPNASDRAYLQTRCDVANSANARLFISIHVNYADATAVRGTTFYYSKPQDVAFAQALERSVIPLAGTQDDGVIKSNLYVTKHTNMPAVLVETGFISNPGDVQLLEDSTFLQRIAAGIAAGVKSYAGALPADSPPTDQ
jgi:N-acetylmuramoyl-L-alanine amidase